MFMYFNVEYYFMMIRRIWGQKQWPGRRKLLLRLMVIVPLTYLFHSVFFFLDKILFPKLWFTKIEKPVFIVGHARSGTTLIQRLMAYDEDRFSYFLYWEMFFPSLLQKKLIRWFGVLDRKLLGSYFFKKLEAWDEKMFGKIRHIHNMGLWVPEEDDFVMSSCFYAAYWQLQAPMMDILNMFDLDRQNPKRRKRVMRHYKECVRRQLYLNGADKTHLSKNPVYSGRVASIIETFPDAQVVVMMRDPVECVPSNLKLMKYNYKGNKWQPDDYQTSLKIIEDISYDCYLRPNQVLKENPQVPSMVVDYRDLVSSPKTTVEAIYDRFGFPISAEYSATLEERQKKNKKHATKHSYSMEEFGMDPERIYTALDEFYQKYDWVKPEITSDDAQAKEATEQAEAQPA
ncbi:sulfotransferase [Endozoicomonas sp. OPT23]|uniref:sulfotransferase family protein n=1 Tax=Endozoicomonas sp. OPT23 TaxID=2072845 RepID=UPI00129A12F0|nr:sulfotransferase [Endozoicomonas sp. OPT23]MRI33817.1 sulfotransferase [Endozoicomonas sp. OPT23]